MPGGLYVADDMDPEQHDAERAPLLARLLATLRAREDLVITELWWGTGLVVAARRG